MVRFYPRTISGGNDGLWEAPGKVSGSREGKWRSMLKLGQGGCREWAWPSVGCSHLPPTVTKGQEGYVTMSTISSGPQPLSVQTPLQPCRLCSLSMLLHMLQQRERHSQRPYVGKWHHACRVLNPLQRLRL